MFSLFLLCLLWIFFFFCGYKIMHTINGFCSILCCRYFMNHYIRKEVDFEGGVLPIPQYVLDFEPDEEKIEIAGEV